jgi:hypothetical protein
MLGNSRVTAQLAASQEGRSFMEFVSQLEQTIARFTMEKGKTLFVTRERALSYKMQIY